MHQIAFDNVETSWSNALPLGNGRMGAMAFFAENCLHVALNHYDCYYQILFRYAKAKKETPEAKPGALYEKLCKLSQDAREKPDIERSHYNGVLHPAPEGRRPQYEGTSHPMAGEWVLRLSDSLLGANTNLHLNIEEAKIQFQAQKGHKNLSVSVFIPKDEDGVIVKVSQSQKGLIKWTKLELPSTRGLEEYPVEYGGEDGQVWLRVSMKPYGELEEIPPEISETAVIGENTRYDSQNRLNLEDMDTQYTLAASVRLGAGKAVSTCQSIIENAGKLEETHQKAWDSFWKSHIQIPDTFLETLWYLHLYIMECASGRGGLHSEQCCGLNGLWDIRRPSLWGSMWYWDVNIQEAFWPAFSSNHLELAEDFCNGYLSFVQDARDFAQRVYGKKGIAIDHPHAMYHCIHPWCAQFLWRYYAYSGDINFLREKAYPVFLEQIAFFKEIAVRDENGVFHIDPDISPEQGPVTRDAVITISCIKQVIQYAIDSAGLLDKPEEEIKELTALLNSLPEYPVTKDGTRWKDSALAPDNLLLRHPSILMPVFPAGEVSKDSLPKTRDLAHQTLLYAAENTEIGMFGFGWIASAAARMGEGTAALRILYEKGLDMILHSNGMGYEETERWLNYCILTKPPLYLPAMSEPSGGIVSAVDEMLLQCENGYLEVFPAIPNGEDHLLPPKKGYYHDDQERDGVYPAWEDCRFDGLLAQGGFTVSAQRKGGRIIWIQVESKFNSKLSMKIPPELSSTGKAEWITRPVFAGEKITFGSPEKMENRDCGAVQTREAAYTHRRVFLGEDRLTAYRKAVDAFICPYGFGNILTYQRTAYVFDFSKKGTAKQYDSAYHRQLLTAEGHALYCTGPRILDTACYSPEDGYGFGLDTSSLEILDRGGPDDLIRDFIQGEQENEFWMDLPRGKYDLLIISGDEMESSYTTVSLPLTGTRRQGGYQKPGQYQCAVLPVVQERDGLLKIKLETCPGMQWKLNALFLNKAYGLL